MNANPDVFDPPPLMEEETDLPDLIARGPGRSLAPLSDALTAVESERVVLSRVLRTTEDLAIPRRLLELVEADDFSYPAHRAIAHIAAVLLEADRCPSPTAILASAKASGHEVGGVEYLAQLIADPVWAASDDAAALADAAIVRDQSIRRRIRASLLGQVASLGSRDVDEILNSVVDDATSLADGQSAGDGPRHISGVVEQLTDALLSDEPPATAVSTGYPPLDEALNGGFRDGEFILIGGRPSMGKTAFALNVGRNIAVNQEPQRGGGRAVLVFSLEMLAAALGMRLVSSESGVPLRMLRSLRLPDEQVNMMADVMHRFTYNEGMRLWIDDRPSRTLEDIRATARQFKREHGKIVVVLDYLQIVAQSGRARDDEGRHVSRVSAGLKQLAKELECPVIALSQLNRSLEQRASKRPILADLRESGTLEQDADIILFLYRDVVYNPESRDPDAAEVIIAKQRDGAIGPCVLRYHGDVVRFAAELSTY
ncbi:AAA family ATPase (plasmid) [Cupriavidus pinatubonensis]|uniref:replicative DNA helicase n=1 Tax=Cupriavidus pinatubonensis TaxID=248026 RepID=UPI001C73BEE5|nr:DnaB-like helicase C-terminal domain-containing protein [Cupriavidus pinatubonensis]QYY33629.1 AAA family ATPase [Cupriavidus pinatubonensis]